ncbi:phytanoyl-CoA dioxygenase family protein [Paraglaciecola sp. 2405UD69-4]|uniref:phytanoyl-CoA dioxygenase family protein n=1 Tax=Paraglaciecola sp. 2405UD69-4 TaxID=3391836 RepID=UPI0039C93D9C
MLNSAHKQHFDEYGYVKLTNHFVEGQLAPIQDLVDVFHHAWRKDNYAFYSKQAVNSSGLTSQQYLTDAMRLKLFELICDTSILSIIEQLIPNPLFMGTQLFFDPVTSNQANYWHRDPQYHLSIEEQKAALIGPEVLHLRVPLKDEPGIELIPGSHNKWDSEEELQVRLQQNGHTNAEGLSKGKSLPLQYGDGLVFSAKMIHRGLYGNNRLSLDILYCERATHLIEFINPEHQPTPAMQAKLNQSLFL